MLTALAFELVIGTPERFHCGKQIASYQGIVASEESRARRSANSWTHSKATLCCSFLVEAAGTVRSQARWRDKFFHLAMRRGRKIAKVAIAESWRVICTGRGGTGPGLRSV